MAVDLATASDDDCTTRSSLYLPAVSVLAWLICLLMGCADSETSYDVDAEPYIDSLCEAQCRTGRDCSADWYRNWNSCTGKCSRRLHGIVDHVCFVPFLNESFCFYDRLSCEQILTGMIPTGPGSPCADFLAAAGACLEANDAVWDATTDSD